jgi:hypothetical protein
MAPKTQMADQWFDRPQNLTTCCSVASVRCTLGTFNVVASARCTLAVFRGCICSMHFMLVTTVDTGGFVADMRQVASVRCTLGPLPIVASVRCTQSPSLLQRRLLQLSRPRCTCSMHCTLVATALIVTKAEK